MQTKEANQVKALYAVINRLAKTERVTKELLGKLSRDILSLHLQEGESQHDVRVINKLLSVLTPVNRKVMAKFGEYFLPYQFDAETCTFGKLFLKDAKKERCYLAMGSFLAEPDNNVWTWQEEHINIEAKPANYAGDVTKAIAKALKHEVAKGDLIRAIFDGGITADDLLEVMGAMVDNNLKQAA